MYPVDVIKLSFVLQFYRSEAWFELNKEQINAARTVQVLANAFFSNLVILPSSALCSQ